MRDGVRKTYYGIFAIIAAIYVSTVFLFAPEQKTLAHFHVNQFQLQLITLALIIPIILIWFTGFVGLVNLKSYARKIRQGSEGKGFGNIALGVTILSVSVAFNGLMSRVLNYAAQMNAIPDVVAAIFRVEFLTIAYLLSFFFIYMGARRLVKALAGGIKKSHRIIGITIFAIVSIAYIVIISLDPSRGFGSIAGSNSTYGIPGWLIILMVVVPYIFVWAFGIFATIFLIAYNRHVKGRIYRQALKDLTKGLSLVLVITIILQFITAAGSMLSSWGLGSLLSLLYILLIVIAAGFLYIARGARKLSTLEDATP